MERYALMACVQANAAYNMPMRSNCLALLLVPNIAPRVGRLTTLLSRPRLTSHWDKSCHGRLSVRWIVPKKVSAGMNRAWRPVLQRMALRRKDRLRAVYPASPVMRCWLSSPRKRH